jgi:hypothetical protein
MFHFGNLWLTRDWFTWHSIFLQRMTVVQMVDKFLAMETGVSLLSPQNQDNRPYDGQFLTFSHFHRLFIWNRLTLIYQASWCWEALRNFVDTKEVVSYSKYLRLESPIEDWLSWLRWHVVLLSHSRQTPGQQAYNIISFDRFQCFSNSMRTFISAQDRNRWQVKVKLSLCLTTYHAT